MLKSKMKSKAFAATALISFALIILSTLTLARTAFAAGDDVFMDEGDGDFDSMPAPPTAATEAPAKKESVAVKKVEAPREQAVEVPAAAEPMPMLAEDPAATPAPAAPDDSAKPVEPKKKKSAKKKKEKVAEAAAPVEDVAGGSAPMSTDTSSEAAAPAPTKHKASKGGGMFVTTKEACPMMRSPTTTGESMLTVKASKKIWVEDAGDGWVKAFNKAGEPGYVSKDCRSVIFHSTKSGLSCKKDTSKDLSFLFSLSSSRGQAQEKISL